MLHYGKTCFIGSHTLFTTYSLTAKYLLATIESLIPALQVMLALLMLTQVSVSHSYYNNNYVATQKMYVVPVWWTDNTDKMDMGCISMI